MYSYPALSPIFKVLAMFVFLNISHFVFAQTPLTQPDSTPKILNIRGSASVTNNGFSFIPAFSLGKPAAIFNFNVNSGKRLSFEPEFRFSLLDAKPWSFVFIWRYKLINRPQFQLVAGAHLPAVPFRQVNYVRNGVTYSTLANYRFLPFELSPNFIVNKNMSWGIFGMYAYGFDDATRHTNFLGVRSAISNIKLSNSMSLRLNPQVFYLRLDKLEGYYASANITLSKKNIPFSLSSMLNKPLKSTIPSVSGKPLDWNVSLAYNFAHTYVRK